jgi:hypothetical protein
VAITLYSASIPVFIKGLTSLSLVLKIAEEDIAARKIDPLVITAARLYPDMLPLTKQIQIATDGAKGYAARLAGVEIPSFADTETTFEELQARIAKTIDFLKTIEPAQIDGGDDRQITIKFPQTTFEFTGLDYLTDFAMPNFYFHLTTAYAILRKNGVKLSKRNFLGAA